MDLGAFINGDPARALDLVIDNGSDGWVSTKGEMEWIQSNVVAAFL